MGITMWQSCGSFEKLEEQTDARSNTYYMEYDKLGRLTEKKLGLTTVASYIYDTSPNGIGLLASVTGDNNIAYSYEYDNLSRLNKITENIQGKSFITETSYNDYSQIKQVIYPGNAAYTVDNQYQNGYLSAVNGTYQNTGNIFAATSFNERGQITGYDLGNGLSTTPGYDDLGFPSTIQTPGVQNLAYEFDILTGNLNRREDVDKILQENFTYDNLMKNRLETWQVNTQTPDTVLYTGTGNIDKKTGLGSFSYEGTQPNAVTGIENTDSLVSEIEQKIAYTPFNKVDTIKEGDYRLEITYGPDNARKISRLFNNDVLQKTKYYVGGIFEKETDGSGNERQLHYITGGDGVAAIFEKTNSSDNLYYIHKDHLGSYQVITDNTGAETDSMSFGPWGNRRNPADWSYPTSQTDFLFDRGFTGHEHLDEFNLINMNGRVYDPILGRFLSPDNYVQMPGYTQNLNRYSYALNNPLVFTDPDGENLIAFIIGAIVGAYLGGTATNDWQWNPGKWNYENPETYFGIVVGGLAGGLGGQWMFGPEGVLAGGTTLNVSLGATYENVVGAFANFSIGGGSGITLETLSYLTLAGGGAYIAGSRLSEMFSTQSKSITISTSTPFSGNGLRGGYGISAGHFEGKDSQGLYFQTFKGEGVSLSLSYDKTYYYPLLDRPVNIQDLEGRGYSLEFDLPLVGYSYGNNGFVAERQGFYYIQPTYRSHTISGGLGIIGYANWETQTRILPLPKWLYKLLFN